MAKRGSAVYSAHGVDAGKWPILLPVLRMAVLNGIGDAQRREGFQSWSSSRICTAKTAGVSPKNTECAHSESGQPATDFFAL